MTTVKRTARLAGLAYLGLAVFGLLGFLLVRGQIFVPGDAAATTANLVGHEALARLGVALDLGSVLTQALAALWFFRLFRRVNSFAAGAIGAFGLVNAVMMLVGVAFSATGLNVALGDATSPGGDPAATAQLLYELSGAAWDVSGLFFGLWLIPMGWLAWRSGYMPRPLGWVLIVGGVGYILSTYVLYLAPGFAGSSALTVPATVGEFWMVGYLLWKGVGPRAGVQRGETVAPRTADDVLTA